MLYIHAFGYIANEKLLKAFQNEDANEAEHLIHELDPTIDINSIKDADGMSLLHLACRCKNVSRWKDIIQELVEIHNCKISAANNGDTPLHTAVEYNNQSAANYLLSCNKCDPEYLNNAGFTAFDIACEKEFTDLQRVLISSGRLLHANIQEDSSGEGKSLLNIWTTHYKLGID